MIAKSSYQTLSNACTHKTETDTQQKLAVRQL